LRTSVKLKSSRTATSRALNDKRNGMNIYISIK
jgi:hypothetical protein